MKKLLDMGKKLLKSVAALAVICVITVVVLKAPELQNKYYRAKVGSKVYMIRDSERSGGGTGFAVKAPSGKSYILTNDHVCGVSSDGKTVLVSGDTVIMRRNIIAHDPHSDLCLIEGVPGVEGLSIASDAPELGDMISIVGHPHLLPKHVSTGELIGKSDITVTMGPISVWNPQDETYEQIPVEDGGILPEQCMAPKNSQIDQDIDLFIVVLKVKWCAVTVKDAYLTAVVGHPGNSGSPVVNFWGNVVGVLFAGSDETQWSDMVPLQDVNSFLKDR